MDKEPEVKGDLRTMKGVQNLIDENLNKVEAQVDSTVEQTVHEIRNGAQKAADRALDSFKGFWERTQEKLDAQISRHPWAVLGGLLLLGYVFARSQQSRPKLRHPAP